MRYYYYCPTRARRFYVTLNDMELTPRSRKHIAMKIHFAAKNNGLGYVFVDPNKVKKEN